MIFRSIQKRGIVINTIVVLVLTLISAGMLYGVSTQISKVLSVESQEKICAFSAVISANTKISGSQLVKVDCPIRLITITQADVRRELPKVMNEIKIFKEEDNERWDSIKDDYERSIISSSSTAKFSSETDDSGTDDSNNPITGGAITSTNAFSKPPTNPQNLLQSVNKLTPKQLISENAPDFRDLERSSSFSVPIQMEFALHSLVGNELRKCWQKTGEGQLDLFSNWYNEEGYFKSIMIQANLENMPATCIICSRIKFDQELKEEFKDRYLSLEFWARMTKPKNKQKTHAEYLMDDSHNKELFSPKWYYSVDEPLVAMYAKIPAAQVGKWVSDVGRASAKATNFITNLAGGWETFRLKPKEDPGVDLLFLTPLSEVKNICGYIANEAPAEVTS
ncbi:TPA: hypothetical protein HA246_02345 [Candidatus Woesearchaeota archaeon]|nr:hypothetical protein [Candidatus Woesearchaeota archaeon]